MSATPVPIQKSPKAKPLVIRRGAVSVPIYITTNTVGGQTYEQFLVSYCQPNGKRKQQKFASLDKAKLEAELIATKLASGEAAVLGLTAADRAHYTDALAALAPHGLSLHAAVSELTRALTKLPPGTSLADAVEFYASRHPASMPPKTVAEVVAELIAEKESANLSDEHLRDLRKRLHPFAKAFHTPIGSVTAELVRAYLAALRKPDGSPVAPRTKLNFLRCICGLFHFARKRRYVPRDLVDEIAEIDLPKPGHVEIGVFTPAQMRALLAVAEADILPALAIGAFAGLRTAELARLDWSEVKLAERVIVVGADKAKTAQRRLVPISDNLAAWLAPHARPFGPVNPSTDDRGLNHRLVRGAAKPAVVTWVRNGLRHSFVSYRLAVTHDPARVATEAGNSPSMVHRHYKALVTEAEGREWFALRPAGEAADVLPLPAAVA